MGQVNQLIGEIDATLKARTFRLIDEMTSTEFTRIFLRKIVTERQKQDETWGEQNHNPVEWISILTEEVGEAAEAANKLHWFRPEVGADKGLRMAKLIDELVQIAAVATAFYESLCRNEIAALNNLEANGDE